MRGGASLPRMMAAPKRLARTDVQQTAGRPRTCARHRSTGCWFYALEMLTLLGGLAEFDAS